MTIKRISGVILFADVTIILETDNYRDSKSCLITF